jgi:hypothetical protein
MWNDRTVTECLGDNCSVSDSGSWPIMKVPPRTAIICTVAATLEAFADATATMGTIALWHELASEATAIIAAAK